MNEGIIIPEPISKNIFEEYYRLIENIKLDIETRNRKLSKENQQIVESLNFLERLVNGIERSIQDITSEELYENKQIVASSTIELLNSWILTLASWEEEPQVIQSLDYHYIAVLSTLENYDDNRSIDTVRYLMKLTSQIKSSPIIKSIERTHAIKEALKKKGIMSFDIIADEILSLSQSDTVQLSSFHYSTINPLELSDALKPEFIKLGQPMIVRWFNDSLDIRKIYGDLKSIEDIEPLRDLVKKYDFSKNLEDLFSFDDKTHFVIWDISIKISDDKQKYDAAEIGYLLWSFSKSLESIDDIEVELTFCGEGSKLFKLTVKIKSLASKVDILQVLKKTRQTAEVIYTEKPLDEIEKYEAEKNKLSVEAQKIYKETKNMMDEEQAKLTHQVDLHSKLLDLQKKELEIEEKKADVRLKNAQYLKQLSDLMANGIIQNNSDVQIMINGILLVEKNRNFIQFGNSELFDVNEKSMEKIEGEEGETSIDS